MIYTVDVIHHLRFQRDRQCTYNVTLMHFRATTVAEEKQHALHTLCVSVALGTQHAMRMRHTVICGLPRCRTYFYIISRNVGLKKKRNVTEHKMCVLIFSRTFFFLNISHSKKN